MSGKPPSFEPSIDPRSPEEWVDRRHLDVLDQLDADRRSLAHMDSRDPGRWRLRRAIQVGEARASNLGRLRELLDDGDPTAGLRSVLELYDEQSRVKTDVNAGVETLSGYVTMWEQYVIDNISMRWIAVTKDTVGLLAFMTMHFEELGR